MSGEILTEYCVCGAELEAALNPEGNGKWVAAIFWAGHMGEGHGKTDRPTMLKGRDEYDRDSSMFNREQAR